MPRTIDGEVADAVLAAFDLVKFDCWSLCREPLEARRVSLAALIDQNARARGGEPDQAILFSVACAEDFKQAGALGCKGIMTKRVGSIYRSGSLASG